MSALDWLVLAATLLAIVAYGVWKGRRQRRLEQYLLADRQMRWYTIALSVMATQASAITFLSTPGQAYSDGMRFVQFYLGLPVAMVILSITAVPIYHRLRVFTAYEYLETRFGPRTRTLTALLFLVQRGLGTAITLYAPALIVSLVLGWNVQLTTLVIGALVILYTTAGGTKAVSWTQTHQLLIALAGMATALVIAIRSLPPRVGLVDAVRVAGTMGRINVIDFHFDVTTPYNFWSGLFGGLMVALAYFGTDQSQVQRYLTGRSVTQSRLGLLVNALVKVPMQFFILFVGAMVFVFYQFVAPPVFFNPVQRAKVLASAYGTEFRALETTHAATFDAKRGAAARLVDAMRARDAHAITQTRDELHALQQRDDDTRRAAAALIRKNDRTADAADTDYVFLTFIMQNLPRGVVGLLLAAIFCAAMSATASGLNSLASSSVVDIWRRHTRHAPSDHRCVVVSKWMTVAWGVFCILFALYANQLGSLIVAVNKIGSYFYGTMLAIFLLAFYAKRVGATAAFWGAIFAETAVILCSLFTNMAWLWWNVVGCVAGVVAALLIEAVLPAETPVEALP
ncbi:MAG: sodium:solute symporter [Acidobacteria bacterium]|nr:sodium:solute symporter [Acidobacteriota bacterium]MBV9474652.1 sodium:solute symporter [Acidobacteriota bacterium]